MPAGTPPNPPRPERDVLGVGPGPMAEYLAADGSSAALICRMVELRDLHTAGHQQRVAALTCAIAQALAMDDDVVHLVTQAALIHDVGKMAVPTQVLCKPGPLTSLEWGLLRGHARTGYELIRRNEALSGTAEIILQHHERLDGSGYPSGLAGRAIRLEARILAVADVVEAMASHRPYRPPLGVDAALEEVSSRAGELFDHEAVTACVQLFATQEFEFPEPVPLMSLEEPQVHVRGGAGLPRPR